MAVLHLIHNKVLGDKTGWNLVAIYIVNAILKSKRSILVGIVNLKINLHEGDSFVAVLKGLNLHVVIWVNILERAGVRIICWNPILGFVNVA